MSTAPAGLSGQAAADPQVAESPAPATRRRRGRRCGVLGSPIRHSLSPRLHRAAYRYLGLDWSYTAHEVREAELAAFVGRLDASWRGLSLTMPLKRAGLELATQVSGLARTVGAVNTLLIEDDGTLRGENTDVSGMVAAIEQRTTTAATPKCACVWGTGATAASGLAALALLGIAEVHVHARDAARAAGALRPAADMDLDVAVRPWRVEDGCGQADLVLSTVPPGAADAMAADLARGAAPGRLLLDVVYDPWPSALAAAWDAAGGAVASGLDLLVHQAAGQIRLMTGSDVPVGVLVAAVS